MLVLPAILFISLQSYNTVLPAGCQGMVFPYKGKRQVQPEPAFPENLPLPIQGGIFPPSDVL
jgi:hypothetical protein